MYSHLQISPALFDCAHFNPSTDKIEHPAVSWLCQKAKYEMKMILHPLISQYARQQQVCLISSPKTPKPQHFFHLKHSVTYLVGASPCSRDKKIEISFAH